jgi:hypothetical protein
MFRNLVDKVKAKAAKPPAPTAPRPTDPRGGLASVTRAALNARGAGKARQAIRLAKRLKGQ